MKIFNRNVMCLGCNWAGPLIDCEIPPSYWRRWMIKSLRCPRCGSSVGSTRSCARSYNKMLEGLAVSRAKNAQELIKPGNPLGQPLKILQ